MRFYRNFISKFKTDDREPIKLIIEDNQDEKIDLCCCIYSNELHLPLLLYGQVENQAILALPI